GPLANPARPAALAVGVADPEMAAIIAGVLAKRGVDGFVFRGDDGLDELTTTTTSQVWSIAGGEVTSQQLDPAELDIAPSHPDDLKGGDVEFNADVVRRFVGGEVGPVRDAVLLNAAAGIAAYEATSASLTGRLSAGLQRASAAVDSGAVAEKLTAWVAAAGSPD
ncbi:MAG: anthranilate phosphoribosyltransferase, partial [Nocardioidaceae bacterium]|nr:anthranilate phosphoribosyltransferase [Nocardioidaceae bacterium]